MAVDKSEYEELSQAYAFFGNTLLKPMGQTSDAGLDPDFWKAFPDFGSEDLRKALEGCRIWAEGHAGIPKEQLVHQVSTEYARLFIGPPEPTAAPWETMHQATETSTGFGKPTFQMKKLLRNIGMQMSNANNQYEDHIGIELLYCSVCYRKAQDGNAELLKGLEGFIQAHPLSWIDDLIHDVDGFDSDGYYANILRASKALLLLG